MARAVFWQWGPPPPSPTCGHGTGLITPISDHSAWSTVLCGLSTWLLCLAATLCLSVCLVSPPHNIACLFHSQECDNLWWDAFTTEFFEDDAMLTITFCLEDGPKRYSEYQLEPSFLRALPFSRRQLCAQGVWVGCQSSAVSSQKVWGDSLHVYSKEHLDEPGLLTSFSSFSCCSDWPDSDSPLLPQHL